MFNVAVLGCFFVAAVTGVLFHEIWLDEAHHWLFARDSDSIQELWSNMRYDGHPILWNVLLFCVSRVSHAVISMQLLNVILSTAAIAVFLFYSPFKKTEKALFVFGYFFLYEYTVISRNYALLLLFLFLALTFYTRRRYVRLGIVLAILSNTHLFGLMFALLFGGLVFFDLLAERKYRMNRKLLIGLVIFASGVLLSLYQVFPPGDSVFYAKAQEGSVFERLGRTSTIFLKGFIPIPDFSNENFWNTNILMEISKPACVVLSVILFAVPLFLFRKKLSLLLFFYIGSGVLIMFFFLSGLNAVRYYGFTYLLLVCCVWMDRADVPKESLKLFSRLNLPAHFSAKVFFVLLIIQFLPSIPSYILDLKRPFSNSRSAALIMSKEYDIKDYLSAGCGAAPVSSYLWEKVFYLNIQSYGSFCLSGQPGSADEKEDRVISDALRFVKDKGKPALLITHFRMSDDAPKNFILIGAYEHSIARNENYFIYKVVPY